jgi:hypothetical protein
MPSNFHHTCFFGALTSSSLSETRSAAEEGRALNAGHFRRDNSCNILKWPAAPGSIENLALLLIYNSFNAVQAPISSGKVFKLFDDKASRFSPAVLYSMRKREKLCEEHT